MNDRSTTAGLLLLLAGCGADAAPTGPPLDASAEAADGSDAADGRPSCAAARDAALGPVTAVSTGAVTSVKEEGAVRTLYVDASAGGSAAAKANPWIYVDLAAGKRVDVDDVAAAASGAWDLALKRPLLRTNSGDSGPGSGGAVFLPGKDLGAITGSEAAVAATSSERWFDEACTPQKDATGAIKTSFDGWYVYDTATSRLTPAAGTWIVRGADGKRRFKVAIETYYGNPDGSAGSTSGRYVLRVAVVE